MNRTHRSTIARTGALALAAVVLTAAGTLAMAAPSVSAAISARQANYKTMGAAMKTLKDQLSSGSPSKAAMVSAAKTLAGTARQQASLFPAGSGPSSGVKTDALPGIWTDRAAFDGQMKKLIAESDKLVAAANSGDASSVMSRFKATGGVCGTCHRQFRADN